MIEERTGFLILAALATFPVLVFFISKRWRSNLVSRFLQVLLSVLLAMVGYIGIFAYAIGGLSDFRNPKVPFSLALTGNIIVWSVCLGAWVFAGRFLILSFRKR